MKSWSFLHPFLQTVPEGACSANAFYLLLHGICSYTEDEVRHIAVVESVRDCSCGKKRWLFDQCVDGIPASPTESDDTDPAAVHEPSREKTINRASIPLKMHLGICF